MSRESPWRTKLIVSAAVGVTRHFHSSAQRPPTGPLLVPLQVPLQVPDQGTGPINRREKLSQAAEGGGP